MDLGTSPVRKMLKVVTISYQLVCLSFFLDKLEMLLLKKQLDNENEETDMCNCIPSCVDLSYTAETSLTKWEWESFGDSFIIERTNKFVIFNFGSRNGFYFFFQD